MAKEKPEYEEVEDFPQLLKRYLDLNGENFPDIRVEDVKCVQIINKERPETKTELYGLEKVKAPVSLFCPVKYFITVFKSDWDIADEAIRAAIISRVCWSISIEDDEPKILPPDTKDYEVMIRTFGVGYMRKSGEQIPNALQEKIEWKFDDEEEN